MTIKPIPAKTPKLPAINGIDNSSKLGKLPDNPDCQKFPISAQMNKADKTSTIIPTIIASFIIQSILNYSISRSFIFSESRTNLMSKPMKIFCPACNRETKLIILDMLENDENMDDEVELKKASDRLPPEMTKYTYDLVREMLRENVASSVITTISRIKSHKIGLFKERCKMSDRVFKIFLYLFMDHEKRVGGFTFHVADEVQNK